MHTYTILTLKDLKEVAHLILTSLADSEGAVVLALHGDLGVGKTAFVKEVAALLGVTEEVTSPTFVVMKQYETEHEKFTSLVHIDAYRIEDESETGPLGLSSIFHTPKTLVCIEWPERIQKSITKDALHITLDHKKDDTRTLTVQ